MFIIKLINYDQYHLILQKSQEIVLKQSTLYLRVFANQDLEQKQKIYNHPGQIH